MWFVQGCTLEFPPQMSPRNDINAATQSIRVILDCSVLKLCPIRLLTHRLLAVRDLASGEQLQCWPVFMLRCLYSLHRRKSFSTMRKYKNSEVFFSPFCCHTLRLRCLLLALKVFKGIHVHSEPTVRHVAPTLFVIWAPNVKTGQWSTHNDHWGYYLNWLAITEYLDTYDTNVCLPFWMNAPVLNLWQKQWGSALILGYTAGCSTIVYSVTICEISISLPISKVSYRTLELLLSN